MMSLNIISLCSDTMFFFGFFEVYAWMFKYLVTKFDVFLKQVLLHNHMQDVNVFFKRSRTE